MTLQATDTSLVIDTMRTQDIWCVYEHHVQFSPEQPPEIILVGTCRLVDVYRLIEGKSNSEWAGLFVNGGHVLVRIIAIDTDRETVVKWAAQHMRAMNPMPRCNLRGFSLRGTQRAVKDATTGIVYASQKEAAEALGLQQSAMSRHLRGLLKHVGGRVFTYVGAGQ